MELARRDPNSRRTSGGSRQGGQRRLGPEAVVLHALAVGGPRAIAVMSDYRKCRRAAASRLAGVVTKSAVKAVAEEDRREKKRSSPWTSAAAVSSYERAHRPLPLPWKRR
uniref:Uncharacterized protein n=2 Tax=Oryza TaxID=4527 RepID=Q6I5C5_ORYSJ|nr:hypothetical protein [Oryza sativa Japonica Group]